MLKDNGNKRKINPNNKAYMNSYDWNYMVLEIVDHIEERLSSETDRDDNWKYFKEYCSLKYLNWRVIKKMIEFSVVQVFTSEADLISYEGFKSLEISTDSISEKAEAPVAKKEVDFDFLEISPKKSVNSNDGYNPFSDGAF